MDATQSPLTPFQSPTDRTNLRAGQIDSAAWALFFIWLGFTILAQVPWGWFLIGVAVLILSAQAVRRQANLSIETFAIVIGLIFLVGGVWELLALEWPLIPILLIVFGAYLLQKAVRAGAASA